MTTKIKSFDCVEMKRRAQESLEKEFESRRGEFASFADFLNAKVAETASVSGIWTRFSEKPSPTETTKKIIPGDASTPCTN